MVLDLYVILRPTLHVSYCHFTNEIWLVIGMSFLVFFFCLYCFFVRVNVCKTCWQRTLFQQAHSGHRSSCIFWCGASNSYFMCDLLVCMCWILLPQVQETLILHKGGVRNWEAASQLREWVLSDTGGFWNKGLKECVSGSGGLWGKG